jgi:hypothetical protein
MYVARIKKDSVVSRLKAEGVQAEGVQAEGLFNM